MTDQYRVSRLNQQQARALCIKGICRDCGESVETLREWAYMLKGTTWNEANTKARVSRPLGTVSTYDCLCVGCVEERLGRRLEPVDFHRCALTDEPRFKRSERLISRIKGDQP